MSKDEKEAYKQKAQNIANEELTEKPGIRA